MARTSKRAHYEQWFEERRGARNRKDEAALLAVADAYDSVMRSGQLTKPRLRTIVDGVSNPRMLVWSGSTDLLRALSGQFAEAADSILEISQHRQAHVRFNALCCLGAKTPTRVTLAVIRAGLKDKSSRVRWKAADKTRTLQLVKLVPELTDALTAETHAKTRSSIEFDLRLLRDGQIVEKDGEGQFIVTAAYPGGICSRGVQASEVRDRGIDAIVAEMRSRWRPPQS